MADLTLVHGWMQEPHVAPWWELEGPVARTEAYLRDHALAPHQRVWIAQDQRGPFGYVETYRADQDALAGYYPARPGDRGWHVLVGDPARLGTPATRALGRAVIGSLLAEPGADRVVCEPDVRNARMLAWCARLGAERLATLELPTKRAALLGWTVAP